MSSNFKIDGAKPILLDALKICCIGNNLFEFHQHAAGEKSALKGVQVCVSVLGPKVINFMNENIPI